MNELNLIICALAAKASTNSFEGYCTDLISRAFLIRQRRNHIDNGMQVITCYVSQAMQGVTGFDAKDE